MRDLRNRTRQVIDQAKVDGEVILTDYGTDIAVIRPLTTAWSKRVATVLAATPPRRDTGMMGWLERDDAQSMSDLE